ncbi:MAG: hypothetical protein KKE05_03520, partial [Nanoarchaeota archaeon]|nr:hypothetical protein [Nanoarchaeota archaeon]
MLVSVTQALNVLKQVYPVSEDVLEAAQTRGTIVHKACASYAKNLWVTVPEEYQGYFNSFRNWFEQYVQDVFL